MESKPQGFFKIFLSIFSSRCLVLPPAVSHVLRGESLEKCRIKDRHNPPWNVKVEKIGMLLEFKEGWIDFRAHHGLTDGDFLTFEYVGHGEFTVEVYKKNGLKKQSLCDTPESSDALMNTRSPEEDSDFAKPIFLGTRSRAKSADEKQNMEKERGRPKKTLIMQNTEENKDLPKTTLIKQNKEKKSELPKTTLIKQNKEKKSEIPKTTLIKENKKEKNELPKTTLIKVLPLCTVISSDLYKHQNKEDNNELPKTTLIKQNKEENNELQNTTLIKKNKEKENEPPKRTLIKENIELESSKYNYLTPFFSGVISHGKDMRMTISSRWLKSCKMKMENSVVLVNGKKKQWKVEVTKHGKRTCFGKGWKSFRTQNNLVPSDQCIFHIILTKSGTVGGFKVNINRSYYRLDAL